MHAVTDHYTFDPSGPRRVILGLADLRHPLSSTGRRSLSELSFLDRAFDEGYRVLDTAAVYGLGASEKGLGRWMRLRRNRHQIAIVTKGGHPRILLPNRHRLTVECLAADIATSLTRLGTDYIDLYLLHRDAADCDVPAVMHYLHEQVRAGTLHAIGVSNWHHTRIEAANAVARERGLTPFTVSSPQLSLLSWVRPPWRGCLSATGPEGAEARAWYRDARMPVLAWSPFGGGLEISPAGAWTAKGNPYRHEANDLRLARAARLAQEKGVSVQEILLGYLASLPCLVHPVCASRDTAHLRANREALTITLSPEEMIALEG
jgi:aryl-alcohol dehydrogenase-like predicted oxidoreductase